MYICFIGVRPANTPKALYPEDQGRTLRNAIRRDAECLRIDGEELEADTSTTRKRVSWCEYDDMHGIGARRASECIRADMDPRRCACDSDTLARTLCVYV